MPIALLTTLLFALTAIFATQAAVAIGPVRANMWRLVTAALILGVWAHSFGQGLGGGQAGLLFLAGIIGFGAGGWCMFQAFPRIGSTLSLLSVECSAALITLLMGWLFLGAAVTPWQIVLALIIIMGIVFALFPFRLPDVPSRTLVAGVAFASTAAVGQSISWTLTKHAFTQVKLNGLILHPLTAAYQRMLGGVCLALVVFVVATLILKKERDKPAIVPGELVANVPAPVWVIANALAGPVLGVSCMLWAIREVNNPGLVQAVVATATLFTVPLVRHFERKIFSWNYFAGALAALGAMAALVFVAG
ncbi:MAG: EamA family transporter [Puniceicoccaceae bacterium]